MKFTSSSTARRSTALASSRSRGSPQMPRPVRRMAPNPRRLTVRSPPMSMVPEAAAVTVLMGPSWTQNLRKPLGEAFFEDGPRLGEQVPVVGQHDELAATRDPPDHGRGLDGQDLVPLAVEQQQGTRRQPARHLTAGGLRG